MSRSLASIVRRMQLSNTCPHSTAHTHTGTGTATHIQSRTRQLEEKRVMSVGKWANNIHINPEHMETNMQISLHTSQCHRFTCSSVASSSLTSLSHQHVTLHRQSSIASSSSFPPNTISPALLHPSQRIPFHSFPLSSFIQKLHVAWMRCNHLIAHAHKLRSK